MKPELVVFFMRRLGQLILGVPVLVGVVVGWTWASVGLGLVAALACWMIAVHFAHNANPLTPWLRARADEMVFDACREGLVSPPRRLYRWMPADPRCRLCLVPFGGVGRVLRIKPSRKNPDFCTDCIEAAPLGVHDREVGILFADIRGFTAWSERHTPAEAADGLARFYALASRVLTRDDALVDLIGDQVMALYLPDFPSLGARTCEVMVAAAERLVAEIDRRGEADVLPVGVGLHVGVASVGNVGGEGMKNFTAIGDVVNTAARLQGAAGAGRIVLSRAVYERAPASCAAAEPVTLSLKGKAEPVEAFVLHGRPTA